MNVKLLRQVADHIEAHPENYEQSHWIGANVNPVDIIAGEVNICGTTACVAGTAVLLAKAEAKITCLSNGEIFWTESGQATLGIEHLEIAQWLFDERRVEHAMPGLLRHIADLAEDGIEITIPDLEDWEQEHA